MPARIHVGSLRDLAGSAAAVAVGIAVPVVTGSLQADRGLTTSAIDGLVILLLLSAALSTSVVARLPRARRLIVSGSCGLAAAVALAPITSSGSGPAMAGFAAAAGLALGAGTLRGRPGPASGIAGLLVAALLMAGRGGDRRVLVAVAALLTVAAVAGLVRAGDAAPQTVYAEARRRLAATPVVGRMLTAQSAISLAGFAVLVHVPRLLTDRGASDTSAATATLLVVAGAAAGVLVAAAMERNEREDRLGYRVIGVALAGAAALLLAAPALPGSSAIIGVVAAAVGYGAATHRLDAAMATSVPDAVRPVLASMVARRRAIGGVVGVLLAGMAARRWGEGTTLALVAPVLVFAAAALRRTGAAVAAEADRVRAEVAADLEATREDDTIELSAGGRRGLLECRGIDFSYGALQVLFDVDCTVGEGEMVALLGTNGAGKSTLLRVISGLGAPSRGTVRLGGEDVTYLDPEGRLRRGIAQVPGGKAVFGTLTVYDNLRAFAFTHGRNRRAVDKGIEDSFEAFPRLHERRHQLAGTLSGGEQQMLALSKALILRPRLLLIDELSLGLAPKIVAELLEMVRRINATGVAVVLVEQSVNVALSLVDHAYFMEKGAMQFDGPAAELVGRGDLLRSVFLEGAVKGLTA